MNRCLLSLTLALAFLSAGCGSPPSTLAPSLTVPPSPTHPPTQAMPGTASPVTQVPLDTTTPTLPPALSPTLAPTPPPAITFSADGGHAFPVAGDLALLTWTHYHWNGSNAVDIEAARELPSEGKAFKAFTQLPVVAVVTGTIAIADNPAGGLALLLNGDDGYVYYYGHLSEQWVTEGQFVQAGERLGRIGNTGRWTQYLEPHLHFSIANHEAGDWRWGPDVNAAEQFMTWFDLPWQDLDIPDYPPDRVAGWPLDVPALITKSFAEHRAENPDLGSIDIVPTVVSESPLPVYATLGGEVNVNRATVLGLRVQITNRPAHATVVYSFLRETTVTDGDVVQRGDLIGYVEPRAALNYMLFVDDVQLDPAATLDR